MHFHLVLRSVSPLAAAVAARVRREFEGLLKTPPQVDIHHRESDGIIPGGTRHWEISGCRYAETCLKTIFKHLDEDKSGEVSKAELQAALGRLGDQATAESIGSLVPDGAHLTEEQLATAVFARRARNLRQQLCLILLTWFMPAAYSACTRLPFICLALEVTETRDGSLSQVGLILGLYQACRSAANGIIAFGGPRPFYRLYLPMVTIGLAGWVASLFLLDHDVYFLLLLCLVGLSEVVVCLQSGLIHETNKEFASGAASPDQIASNLRKQYIAVSGGSFVAYVAGGALYTEYGFVAICWFGVATQAIQIISFGLYVLAASSSTKGASGQSFNDVLRAVAYQMEAIAVLGRVTGGDIIKETVNTEQLASAKMMVTHDRTILGAVGQLYDNCTTALGSSSTATFARTASSTLLSKRVVSAKGINVQLSAASTTSQQAPAIASKVKEVESRIIALLDDNGDGHVSKSEFVNHLAPLVYHSMFGLTAASVGVVWPYMRVVIVTQAVMALCIGSFLSTSLLLYTQEFDVSASTVGMLLGIGEGLGALVIFITSAWPTVAAKLGCTRSAPTTEAGGFFGALLGRPLHVPLVLLIVGAVTMGFSIPQFGVAIVCQMVMSSMNDLSVTLLNELTATSLPPAEFKANHALGQWLRRLGNMLTGVTGPILFSIFPGLPFLVYGGIVFLWSCFLWVVLHAHAQEVVPAEKRVGSGPLSAFRPFAGNKPLHQYEREYYFAHRDMLVQGSTEALQSAALEQSVRRLRTQLQVEMSKRKQLEAGLAELKDTIAPLLTTMRAT